MSKVRTAAGKAKRADHTVARKTGKKRDTKPVKVLGTLSEVGDQPPLVALSLATIAAGAATRSPALVRGGVRMLASHALATGIKTVIKRNIDRRRPASALAAGKAEFKRGQSRTPELSSFPSGHTAGAVAVAQAVARDAPAGAWPARGVAGAVAGIQLPRGKHYLGDVLAGAAIGIAAEWLVSKALSRVERAITRATD